MGLSPSAPSAIETNADEIDGFNPIRWERRILSHLDRL
jgi:hypothetical protein